MIRDRAVQKDLERIGKDGCYFLSIVAAIEQWIGIYLDIHLVYTNCLAAGFIKENCYVNFPDKIATAYIGGGEWEAEKTGMDYKTKESEIEILRYERTEGMDTFAHFVLGDGLGGVLYDPYGASLTVRLGKPVSKRILRRK